MPEKLYCKIGKTTINIDGTIHQFVAPYGARLTSLYVNRY